MSSTGYSGTPLPRKLGIAMNARVLVDGGDAVDLGVMPTGVVVHRRPGREPYDVAVVFCPDAARLRRRFGPVSERLTSAGALWVAWPKRASGVSTDLTEDRVREIGLDAGLVDVKVCAIDSIWSGLKFVRRLTDRPASEN